MDFIKYKCPVCNKQFEKDEDIVVCPECGTPHHRECYEQTEHCFFEDKHSEGFAFEEANAEESADNSEDGEYKKCGHCGAENPKEIFYCQQCGAAFEDGKEKNSSNADNANQAPKYNTQGHTPFGHDGQMPPFVYGIPFDPMAGMNSNDPIAENITAGEAAKYVGKNTPYFLRIFSRIKSLGSSKYNFCAFLLSGAYFLYRKMYALGVIFSIITLATYVSTYYVYTMPMYKDAYNIVMANANGLSLYSLFYTDTSVLSVQQMIIFNLPTILNMILFIVRIICGAVANRLYYKHCTKEIGKIKSTESIDTVNSRLEAKGGVNLAAAICAGVIYIAVTYMPMFIRL